MSQPPIDPYSLTNLFEATKGVLEGLPILAVMWYMLKDIRREMREVKSDVEDLNIKIASNTNHVEIKNLNDIINYDRSNQRKIDEEIKIRLTKVEDQLSLIWIKVGTRPEDIRKRNGEHS